MPLSDSARDTLPGPFLWLAGPLRPPRVASLLGWLKTHKSILRLQMLWALAILSQLMHTFRGGVPAERKAAVGAWAILCAAFAACSFIGAPDVCAAEAADSLRIELQQAELPEGAILHGSVHGSWSIGQLPEDKLVLRLVWIDAAGRVVTHAELKRDPKTPGEPISFAVQVQGGLGRLQRLAALVASRQKKKNDEPVGWRIAAEAGFRIVRAGTQDFLVLAPATEAAQRLTARGVNGFAGADPAQPGVPELLERSGLPFFATNILTAAGQPFAAGARAEPFDETALKLARDVAGSWLRDHARLAPLGYTLGAQLTAYASPEAAAERPFDSSTLEIFRGWLQQRYGNLAALNAAWDMSFPRWEEVLPPTTAEVKAVQVAERENFAGWCDWHAFMGFAFARVLEEQAAFLRQGDALARVGLVATQAPGAWNGHDWTALARVLDWCEPAGADADLQCNLYLSLRAHGQCLARLDGPETRRQLWSAWLSGASGVRFEDAATLEAGTKEQDADLRLLAQGLARQRDAMRAGHPAVAIYYSPRSLALHWLLDGRADGHEWSWRAGEKGAARDTGLQALRAWRALLLDLGYQPVFVTASDVRENRVQAKVLVLPKVLSLSGDEVVAIRAFAQAGGVVLADSQCGLFDGAGRRHSQLARPGGPPRHSGALDEDFGLVRKDVLAHERDGAFDGDAQAARVLLEDPVSPALLGPLSAELRVNEPGVRAAGAWRYGRTLTGLTGAKEDGAAAVLVRASGLGRFVYLNLALQNYPVLRTHLAGDFAMAGQTRADYERAYGAPVGGEALRILLGGMLAESTGECGVIVRDAAGLPLRCVARIRWSRDGADLIALLPPVAEHVSATLGGPAAQPYRSRMARVELEDRRHWYDVRAGRYLGAGQSAPVTLEPRSASVLAALPYRVKELQLKVRRTNPKGGYGLALQLAAERAGAASNARPGAHAVSLEVYDPEGRHLPHYDRTVVAVAGRWKGVFALGLNEPAGTYRLLCRDVLTGTPAEAQLLKEGALYAEVLPVRAAEQRWSLVAEPAHDRVELAADGSLLYHRRIKLSAAGRGFTVPPLGVEPPKPWSFERFTFPDGRLRGTAPEPEPLEVDVVLRARSRDLKPGAPAEGGLVLKQANGEERAPLPLFVTLIPNGERGSVEVDGNLNDRGWDRAWQAEGFDVVDGGHAAAELARVYLRSSDTHLLIGAVCEDEKFDAARACAEHGGDRDDEVIENGDWFEVAVAVQGTQAGPVRIKLDPRGNVCDARGSDAGWNLSGESTVAAAMQRKGWSTEIAIAWKDLGLERAPGTGCGLRLGFARRRVLEDGTSERSAWRGGAPWSADALGLALTVGRIP